MSLALANDSVVEGNIDERGRGYVLVDSFEEPSLLKGNISERGPGYIWVFESTVEGNLAEHGPGVIKVESSGLVKGNACEGGPPSGIAIFVDGTSTVEGNLEAC